VKLNKEKDLNDKSNGKTCAILGPGNFECPNDILTKLFVQRHVVVYKPHPLNFDATIKFFKVLFKPLIDDGYLTLLETTDIQTGANLLNHKDIDEAMMTGGALSYDKIVWGNTNDEIVKNKQSGQKKFTKPFDAELGAASPWIIVPGTWTAKEMAHNANYLVASKSFNSGHVCASPQTVVVDQDWPQKKEFYDAVKVAFGKIEKAMPYYYPGTNDRNNDFINHYSKDRQVETLSVKGEENKGENKKDASWHVFFGVKLDSHAVRTECFGNCMAIVELPTKNDPSAFMKSATKFANDSAFGSLSLTVIIDPKTEAAHKNDFDDMISNLEWGSIGINEWATVTLQRPGLTWGAFPKHKTDDIQSGMGIIHNSYLYENVQKSVVKGVWMSPTHTLIPTKYDSLVWTRLAYLTAYPSYWRLTLLLSAKLLGY